MGRGGDRSLNESPLAGTHHLIAFPVTFVVIIFIFSVLNLDSRSKCRFALLDHVLQLSIQSLHTLVVSSLLSAYLLLKPVNIGASGSGEALFRFNL